MDLQTNLGINAFFSALLPVETSSGKLSLGNMVKFLGTNYKT